MTRDAALLIAGGRTASAPDPRTAAECGPVQECLLLARGPREEPK